MLREGKTQLGSVLMVLYHSYKLVQEEANETNANYFICIL